MRSRYTASIGVVVKAIAILLLSIGLAACNAGGTVPTTTSLAEFTPQDTLPSIEDTPTFTLLAPTPTPVEAIARVNGEAISLAALQAALTQVRSLSGTPAPTPEMAQVGTILATDEGKKALDDLVNQVLLSQAAVKAGFSITDQVVQDHYEKLVAGLGSPQALQDWMTRNGYSEESFRQDLARSIAAAWMRDQIISTVPEAAEQVHVRQILTYSADKADEALAKLNSGNDFAMLAAEYDPITKGDLGWFPRGYLTDPVLEQAAFDLEPGKYSEVIKTSTGYHILQVIERDPQRPLDPDARLKLQMQALQNWLTKARGQSDIQILSP
jgi:peptidyl-prolyl cis-trans isomerase C